MDCGVVHCSPAASSEGTGTFRLGRNAPRGQAIGVHLRPDAGSPNPGFRLQMIG